MKRSPRQLSQALRKRLETYALAATLSGTGLLFFAMPSEAEVVYTSVNIKIAPNSSHAFDLNHDGIIDFTIWERRCYCTSLFHKSIANFLYIQPAAEAAVEHTWLQLRYASAIGSGVTIPDKRNGFDGQISLMERIQGRDGTYYTGDWEPTTDRYLALAFRINGQVHYGWARMSVGYNFQAFTLTPHLTGFAYETEPGKPIITGDTGTSADAAVVNPSLGALAAGSPGLPAWRK